MISVRRHYWESTGRPFPRADTLDTLAAFASEGEDRENDLEDEEETDLGALIDEGGV